ncbi:MAG: hypothetical protein OXU37_03090 [Thaumarchaeota archaeon]|nr:hypothetical protein [Nitrososphaerota archaeon]
MTYLAHPVGVRSLVFFSGIGVASIIIVLASAWDAMARLAGVMAAAFIVYGLLAAWNSERVRRIEDEEAINDARELAEQCVELVEMIARIVAGSRTGDIPGALEHLSSKASLLVTRYRKYLDPDAAIMAIEAERMAVRAHVYGAPNMRRFLASMTPRVHKIARGIRDIDDEFLHRSRRAI